VGHALRSSGLLHVKVSLARVFQSGLKTSGGVTTRGARGTITERLRRRQVEDGRIDATGCVGPCYTTFVVVNVLVPRGIVVIQPFAWAYI
jgi:hypothetical protein